MGVGVSYERGHPVARQLFIWTTRCPAHVAHLRQSRPEFCLGFKAKVVRAFHVLWVVREEGGIGNSFTALASPLDSGVRAVWGYNPV